MVNGSDIDRVVMYSNTPNFTGFRMVYIFSALLHGKDYGVLRVYLNENDARDS